MIQINANMVALLEHSALCSNPYCSFQNCNEMQKLSKHFACCKIFPCDICKKMTDLTTVHSQQCEKEHCLVTKCNNLK